MTTLICHPATIGAPSTIAPPTRSFFTDRSPNAWRPSTSVRITASSSTIMRDPSVREDLANPGCRTMPADASRAPVRRVMITAAGTVTAQSVIKALHEDGRTDFVAAGDMNPLNARRAPLSTRSFELPPASSAHSRRRASKAARVCKIDLLVPLIVESEFLPLDDARALFDSIGCRLALPARESSCAPATSSSSRISWLDRRARTGDAVVFTESISRRTVSGLSQAAARLRIGRHVARREPSLASRSGAWPARSYRARGGRRHEFTVDCFAAEPGRVVAAVPRERIAIKAGVSVKGRTYHHPLIEKIARDVVEKSELTDRPTFKECCAPTAVSRSSR